MGYISSPFASFFEFAVFAVPLLLGMFVLLRVVALGRQSVLMQKAHEVAEAERVQAEREAELQKQMSVALPA